MKRRRTLVALLLLPLLALAGVIAWLILRPPPAVPLSTPGGPVAFMTNREGNWDIYCLDASGALANLTGGAAHDYFPAFSFDGAVLLFVTTAEESDLATMLELASGRRIVFGEEDIVTVALETYAKGRIDWGARWFRGEDGQLARVGSSLRDISAQLEVFAYENALDESGAPIEEPRQISDGAPLREWMPDISPDGRLIAFISNRAGSEDIHIVPYAGGEIRALAPHPAEDFAPFWSLDGQWIAFFSERDQPLRSGATRLYAIRPDGSGLRELTNEARFAGGGALAPDGQSLVYTSNESGRWHLYQKTPPDSAGRPLTQGEHDNLFPTWLPQQVLCQPTGE